MNFYDSLPLGQTNICNKIIWKKVIVIGAGGAGIGAGRVLIDNNIDFVILEARNRIGGRLVEGILSNNLAANENDSLHGRSDENESKLDEITISLGPNWLHGLDERFNPLTKVAKQLNFQVFLTSSDDEPGDDVLLYDILDDGDNNLLNSTIVDTNHGNHSKLSCLTKAEYDAAITRYDWIKDNLERLSENECRLIEADPNYEPISLHQAFELTLQESEAIFGPITSSQRRCLNWFQDRIAIDLATLLGDASLPAYVTEESDGEYGEALVEKGIFKILSHLAEDIQERIIYDSVVKKIILPIKNGFESDHESTPGVIICLENGSIYHCDACILTVPLGVLKSNSIEFVPNIPRPLQDHISKLESGLMNLIWLRFPYPFWPKGIHFIGVTRETKSYPKFSTFLIPPHLNNSSDPTKAVLMCQVVGPFAYQIETMTDAEIASEAMIVLRKIFSDIEIPNAIGCIHSCWSSDPFARGSWSHVSKDCKTSIPSKENTTTKILNNFHYAGMS
jgi:monoamine oxidase